MSLRKSAKPSSPHAIFAARDWEWRVLKTYKAPASEAKDQYARWFLSTSSPYVEGELGDGYARDVRQMARLVAATTEWLQAYYDDAVHMRAAIATPEEYLAQEK